MPTDLIPFLTIEHAAAGGSGAQIADFCEAARAPAGNPVSGGRWRAALDGGSVPPIVERVADGRTLKALSSEGATATVRLFGQPGGSDPLGVLSGRVVLGRSATLALAGTAADGTVYTVAAPLVIVSGRVVEIEDDLPYSLAVTIRAHAPLFRRTLPRVPLRGYPGGVIGNGAGASTTVITTGNTTMPAEVTLVAFVLVPLAWDLGASDVHTIAANRSLWWYAKRHTDGWSWRLAVKYTTDAGGSQTEILGPVITPDNKVHPLSLQFDTAASGGGVSATFGDGASFTVATSATAWHLLSEQWQMMRYRSDATSVTSTLIYGWMFFSSLIGPTAIARYIATRAPADADDLFLFYPGPVVSGQLLDYAAANASAPYDATVTAGTAAPSMEGDEGQAGKMLPLIYRGQHMPAEMIDPLTLTYRVASADIEGISRVVELGADITVVHADDPREFLVSTPGATEATVTGWLGGGVRLGAELAEPDRLAVDVQGVGGWPWSVILGSNHGSAGGAYVSFPTALNSGGNDFKFDLYFSYSSINSTDVVFTSGFVRITRVSIPGRLPQVFTVEVFLSPSGDIEMEVTIPTLTTVAMTVEARELASTVEARVLINGRIAATGESSPTTSLGTATPSVFLGFPGGFPDLGALPMRLWGPGAVATTDAEAEASARKFLFRHPVDGEDAEYSDLVGMWTRPDPSSPIDTVLDDIGTNDGTVVNPGTYGRWRPGLCSDGPLAAAVKTLRDAGVDDDAITIAASAWDIEAAPQSLWAEGEEDVASVVDRAIGPGYALLRADGTVLLGKMLAPTSGNAVGTLTGAEVYDISPGKANQPPSVILARWGMIGVEQEPVGTADAARAALMSRRVREEVVPIAGNADTYQDEPYPEGRALELRGVYRDRAAALAAAEDLAAQEADPYPVRTVTGIGAGRSPAPGEVWGVTDPRDGSVAYYRILARKTDALGGQGRPPADEWEVR